MTFASRLSRLASRTMRLASRIARARHARPGAAYAAPRARGGVCCPYVVCAALWIATGNVRADTFPARAATFLHHIAERHQGPDFAIVTAKIMAGVDRAEAMAKLDTLLSHPSGDMFYMYASMGCLLYCRDSLPPVARDRFRQVWNTYTFYRGDTENHFLMYYAGLFLAAQEWPGLPGSAWFNGKSSDENLREAREYLLQWSGDVARYGLVEFDSPRYLYYVITPCILLREFSSDTVMRTRAELMLDYLFTDFAGDYLAGNCIGASSRDGESSSIAPRTAEAISYAALYFGDVDVARPLQDVAFAALSSYRLPEIIRAIAIEKPHAVVHTETRRARAHLRFGGERQPVVFKYDYVTPDFALGSLQGSVMQPIQQRSWSLTFASRKSRNRVFGLHPTHSARELGTFFPEELGLIVGDIGKAKAGYASEDKWIGGSDCERITQNKSALIALYDIAADDPVQHVDVYLPSDLDSIQRDPSGWVFLAEGKSFAAVRMLREYRWIDEADHIRIRIDGGRTGYVVIAGSLDLRPQIRSFDAFKAEVRRSVIDTSMLQRSCEVGVQVGNRAPVHAAFHRPPVRDSASFADSEFPALRQQRSIAPHAHSERGTGVIEISRPGETLVLDFVRNEIRLGRE